MYNFQHFLWDMNKCIGTNSCNKSGDARKKKRRRRHTHFLAHLGVSKLINSLSFCVVCANWIMGGEKYSKELNLNCRRVTWTSQPFVKDAVIGGIMWFSWCDSIHVILVHGIGRLCFFFCFVRQRDAQRNICIPVGIFVIVKAFYMHRKQTKKTYIQENYNVVFMLYLQIPQPATVHDLIVERWAQLSFLISFASENHRISIALRSSSSFYSFPCAL